MNDEYDKLNMCLGENWSTMQAVYIVVAIVLVMYMLRYNTTSHMKAEAYPDLPPVALGIGSSNVMGFYQGFDQLWGPGSSSYSADDGAYQQLMFQDTAYSGLAQH